MLPNTVEFLGRERDQERYQEAEHIRLVKIARGEQSNSVVVSVRLIGKWVGGQMVKWGSKLQGNETPPLTTVVSTQVSKV